MEKVQELIKALKKAVEIDNDINVFDNNEIPNYEEYFTAQDNYNLVNMIHALESLTKEG
tara:strand:+ start:1340 stop:1516 length:177 start_codon:yes stop_codon:yes gene_type:complete